MFTGLGSQKNYESKALFYNSITWSLINDSWISFKYEKPWIIKTRDIFPKTPDETFDITGKLEWVEESRNVSCVKPKKKNQLRNALLADGSSSMYACQNFHQLELASQIKKWMLIRTSTIYPKKTKTWCPFFDTVKLNKYFLCVDKDYRIEVAPHPCNGRVLCVNPMCTRKMCVSRCKRIINAELLLADKEYDTK